VTTFAENATWANADSVSVAIVLEKRQNKSVQLIIKSST